MGSFQVLFMIIQLVLLFLLVAKSCSLFWVTKLMFWMISLSIVLIYLKFKTSWVEKVYLLWIMATLVGFFFSESFPAMFIFFEISIIPMMFLIVGWGYNPERLSACLILLIYATVFSLSSLAKAVELKILNISSFCSDSTICLLAEKSYFLFIIAFVVKTPLFFFHSWLNKAHVEAPTLASAILSGILLKLGVFGVLKFSFILDSSFGLAVGIVGVFLSMIMLVIQTDSKLTIAFSSINHMTMISVAIEGGGDSEIMFIVASMMVAHAIISPFMFILSGDSTYKSFTRNLHLAMGILRGSSILVSVWFCVFVIFNTAIPPFVLFYVEKETLLQLMHTMDGVVWVILITLLGAVYYNLMLFIYSVMGKIKTKSFSLAEVMKLMMLLIYLTLMVIVYIFILKLKISSFRCKNI